MKRRFSLFALLLALLLALSACGGQPSPQPQQPLTTLQELQELLTRDYIVGYLWYCDGLPEQGELTEDEYLPVDPAGGYATLADLQKLVEKTYTPACVSAPNCGIIFPESPERSPKMKRRFSLFALLLALLLALSACGGQPSPQPQQPLTTLQELQELLTRDYIVGYLWYCDGLPEQGELTEDEYLPVDPAGGYATLADLQKLVEKTYTPACVSALLQNADTLGRPRFVEREGRLYKSSRPVFSRYYWDYDAESVTITEETAENLTFTVTMQNLHTGEMLPLTRTAQKTAEGWRLAEVGIPAAEADLTTAAAEETRAIAEKFVAALVENNIWTIAACAGEAPETYQNWRGMSIPTAEITETLEEYDGCGRYRVHMAVENAFGVFAKGEEDYLLIVQQEQGQETPVICYYEPMEKIAYNYSEDRDDPACEMALLFLQAEGGMRFNGSFWLDRATATDFALTMLYAENEGKTAFTAEEVTAAAQKYMGLTGFAPDESYLGAEGYILPGRAARSMPHLLLWPSYQDGSGRTLVKAEIYSDHLNTQNCQGYLFAFYANEAGSLGLSSVT